ncbi:MAG: SMC-Scp complex subunit ScpB [Patescibacteria group bacterium]
MTEVKNPENQNITGAIEALLFVYGEPLETKRISKILKTSELNVKNTLQQIEQESSAENRGFKLIFSNSPAGEFVQLATKPEFSSIIENIIKEESKENLTPASLETLSLISYLGPVSRAQIDFYRGVNSSFILRALLIRGLVERFLDSERANMYLYQPSFDLLKYLGVSKVEDLPEYEKYKTMTNNNNNDKI